MKLIGDRIKLRRIQIGLSQDELAHLTDYKSRSTINKIELNQRNLRQDQIVVFAQALHTSPAYLMGWTNNADLTHKETILGNNNSEIQVTLKTYPTYQLPQCPNTYVLNKCEKNHIEMYRTLSQEEQIQVDTYTAFIAQSSHNTESIKIATPIKYYDMPVSAGTGQFIDRDNYIMLDVLEVPPPEAEFIVRVCGNSMEPTYNDGDKLYIKPQKTVEIGEIGIFSINGEVFVKERDDDGLISHNKEYDKIIFNEGDSIVCFGKVIGVCDNYR